MSREPSETALPAAPDGALARLWLTPAGTSPARLYDAALLLTLVLAASAVFHYRATIAGNVVTQGPNFVYPYFSGAAHLDSSLAWKYDPEGLSAFKRLSAAERFAYDFSPRAGETLRDYRFNNIGYVFAIWLAHHLFPFLSAITAIVALQCLVHIACTWFIATTFAPPLYRALFVVGYGLNPLVLHFVASPFYYYLQVLPSAMLLLAMHKGANNIAIALAMYATLFLSFVLRPSLLPLILLIVAVALVKSGGRARVAHAVMAVLLIAGVGFARQPTEPWHTAYVGLGAYANPYGIELQDENGYAMYERLRGTAITTDLPDGTFYDRAIRDDYYGVARVRYLEIVTGDVPMVIRNTLLNLLQSFSIGYLVDRPALRIASAIAGVAVLAALLYSRQFLLVLALGAASVGTAVFFPPIPAYMNGNYLLLAYGMVTAMRYHLAPR